MAIQTPPPSASVLGQGVSYPLQFTADGRLRLSWGPDLVKEALHSICVTQPGERVMLPDYGGGSGTFEVFDDARAKLNIEKSIADYEPRIRDVNVEVNLGETPSIQVANIFGQVDGEASARTLTIPLFTGPAVTGASK